MSEFREFLGAVQRGECRQDLFIYPTSTMRELAMVGLADLASMVGLYPLVVRSERIVRFDGNPSVAHLTVVHPYIDRQVRGREFHAVHGLDYLDALENADEIREEVKSRVRL